MCLTNQPFFGENMQQTVVLSMETKTVKGIVIKRSKYIELIEVAIRTKAIRQTRSHNANACNQYVKPDLSLSLMQVIMLFRRAVTFTSLTFASNFHERLVNYIYMAVRYSRILWLHLNSKIGNHESSTCWHRCMQTSHKAVLFMTV